MMGCLGLLLAAALAVTFPSLSVPVLALVVLWGLLSNSRRKRRMRKRRERILVERATERERKRLKRKARADERGERREKKRLARRESRNQLKGRGRNVEPEKRLSTGRSQQGHTHQSLSIRLLQEALDREGRLTVTQGVTATEELFQAVEACLESMATKGYVDVDNHPESGAVVYVFAAMAPKAPVFRQRRKAIERVIRRDRKRRGMPTTTEPVQLSSLLLYEAQERGGRLAVTQGVMATGESYEAVEACLQGMVDNRYVDVDNDPGSGVVVYVFAEMTAKTSDDRVSEPRSVQVRAAAQALLDGIRRVRVRRRGKQPEPTDSPMTPNTDDADALCGGPRDLSAGVEDDFHLIDDPPEQDGGHARSKAAGGPECDEAPETDLAEHGGAARSRSAVGSAVSALRRGMAGVGRAAGAVGDGVAGSAKAVGGRVSDVSVRAGRLTSDSLKRVPVRRLSESVASKAANLWKRPPRD